MDKTNELIVLSFRGSSSFDNWIANIDFVKTDVDLCDGCEAHSGFWEAWGSVADSVTSQIDSALSTYSGYKLVITGHSLGAALATLGGVVLRNSGHTLDLVCPYHKMKSIQTRELIRIRIVYVWMPPCRKRSVGPIHHVAKRCHLPSYPHG